MKIKRIIALSLALALMFSMIPFAALATTGPERLSGDNRYLTAAAISQAGWDKSDIVVLARGDEFADALAGVGLAHKLGAPILLTTPNKLHPDTKTEIARLEAKEVIILGGLSAVSTATEDELKALGLTVERISGSNRHATAAAIASKIAPNGVDTAVIVIGANFPDALAAASYAAAAGYPILLTEKNTLPQDTKAALLGLGIQHTIVVGGPAVITDAVLADLPDPVRVFGGNRYATAIALADHFEVQADHFYVATGKGFADAITGSVLAAKEGTGLLLADSPLSPEVATFITANKVKALTILGGEGTISLALQAELAALLSKLSVYELSIAGPSAVERNEPTAFAVTLKGDDTGVLDFTGTLSYSVEGGTGVLEYNAGDAWVELPLTGSFGPAGGFTITPDWDETTQLRFTATEIATYTVTITLSEVDGDDLATVTKTFATGAGVAPEEFAVTSRTDINYYGYSVGFRLTEGLTPADLTAVQVSLFKGDKLLVTNTAKAELFELIDLQHTSPFNIYAEFEGYIEEYWNLGNWVGDILEVPDKAVITVTTLDGRVIIAENTNLTGDLSTILPKVWNIDQAKAFSTIQAAITAAQEGETLLLAPGTHTGILNITKGITLVGADAETVFIDASAATAYGIYVKADDVTFSNFTFLAPTEVTPHTYGFKVEYSNNVTIQDVTVIDSNRTGVDLHTVTGAVIDNVVVQGTAAGVGIALTNSQNVVITNTTTTGNAWGGIAIFTTGQGIVIGEGNVFDVLYTQGSQFELDLTNSDIQYKLTNSASPAFTLYFQDTDVAVEAAQTSTTTVLSNLEATEFYVVEGMGIQTAVAAAGEGAVVLVYGGEYNENISIQTDGLILVSLEGAQVNGYVVVNASDVTISGFVFLKETAGAILRITGNADNTVITNNGFIGIGTAMGIVLDTGTPTNVLIEANIFRFLHSGLYIHRAENVTFIDNFITDVTEGVVSIETWAKNVVIEGNTSMFADLVFFWSQYYSTELVFDDEITIGDNEVFLGQVFVQDIN